MLLYVAFPNEAETDVPIIVKFGTVDTTRQQYNGIHYQAHRKISCEHDSFGLTLFRRLGSAIITLGLIQVGRPKKPSVTTHVPIHRPLWLVVKVLGGC